MAFKKRHKYLLGLLWAYQTKSNESVSLVAKSTSPNSVDKVFIISSYNTVIGFSPFV